MKCSICGKGVEKTFLGKVVGTYVKVKGKKVKVACPECQHKFPEKNSMMEHLK